eukprot:6213229-Pleurochrysis_carterae.AAC.1
MVDPRHIARTRWRRIFRVECEAVHVHVRVRDGGVELVRLNKSEPRPRFLSESWLIIQVQRSKLERVAIVNARIVEPVVALFLALAAHGPHEFDDWMVELELKLNICVLRLNRESLRLYDENLKLLCRVAITLFCI